MTMGGVLFAIFTSWEVFYFAINALILISFCLRRKECYYAINAIFTLYWEVCYFAINSINAVFTLSREVCYFGIYAIFTLRCDIFVFHFVLKGVLFCLLMLLNFMLLIILSWEVCYFAIELSRGVLFCY